MTRHCTRCGTAAEGDGDELPLGWSFATDEPGSPRARVQWMCLACTREHVRAIEAKLPEEWW